MFVSNLIKVLAILNPIGVMHFVEYCIMAVTRFWAPLLILFFSSLSISKWNKSMSNHDLDSCGSFYAISARIRSLDIATLLGKEAGYRECIRAKKSLVVFRLGSNGHSQLVMLLLLGGDIEVNPGADKRKFSCGICSNSVRKNQARIQCDQCSNRFHVNANCCEISPAIFSILENSSCTWICPQCGLPSLSDSFFDSSMDSFNSSNYFEPLAASLESPAPSQFHPQDKNKGKPARRIQA